MRSKLQLVTIALQTTLIVSALPLSAQVAFEWVTVDNPANAADSEDGDQITPGVQNFGAIPYTFRISRYEVTNDQYAAFLNAVAQTDTNNLYNTQMGDSPRGGIQRTGTEGSFSYSAKPKRFHNW